MPEVLTDAQIAQYRRDGCVFPIDIAPAEQAAEFRAAFEATERAAWGVVGRPQDDAEGREWLRRPHHFHRWAFDLCSHPRIVGAVADLLGPDVMLWDSKLFPKPAHSRSFVSWHQDATYVGLRPLDKVLTVWFAMTDAGPGNGGMTFLAGSHERGQLGHTMTREDGNLLSRGQVVEYDVPQQQAQVIALRAGQASIHHQYLIHGSAPNPSSHPRIGISVNFDSPDVIETGDDPRPAVLLRGEDRYGHFAPLQVPG